MKKFPRSYISVFAWWPSTVMFSEDDHKIRLQTIANSFSIDCRVYIIIHYSFDSTNSCQITIQEIYSVKNVTFIQIVAPPKSSTVYQVSHPTQHRFNLNNAPIRAIATVCKIYKYIYRFFPTDGHFIFTVLWIHRTIPLMNQLPYMIMLLENLCPVYLSKVWRTWVTVWISSNDCHKNFSSQSKHPEEQLFFNQYFCILYSTMPVIGKAEMSQGEDGLPTGIGAILYNDFGDITILHSYSSEFISQHLSTLITWGQDRWSTISRLVNV